MRAVPDRLAATYHDDLRRFMLYVEHRGESLRHRPLTDHIDHPHRHIGVGINEGVHFGDGDIAQTAERTVLVEYDELLSRKFIVKLFIRDERELADRHNGTLKEPRCRTTLSEACTRRKPRRVPPPNEAG